MSVKSFVCLDLLSCRVGLFGVLFAVTSLPRTPLILCLCSNTLAGCSASVCLHTGCCKRPVSLAASGPDLADSLLLGTMPDCRDLLTADRGSVLSVFRAACLTVCLSEYHSSCLRLHTSSGRSPHLSCPPAGIRLTKPVLSSISIKTQYQASLTDLFIT